MAQDEKKRQSFIQPKKIYPTKEKKNVSGMWHMMRKRDNHLSNQKRTKKMSACHINIAGPQFCQGFNPDSTYEKVQQTVVKPQAPWWVVGPQTATHIVGCGGRVGRVGPRVLARQWLVVFQ